MATFKRCDESVNQMADELIAKYHQSLKERGVKIDYVFAFGKYDEISGESKPALTKNGVECLGITRKLSLKDRAMGRGDAEIALDGDWWNNASDKERAALLDHELYHLVVTVDTDDLRRPILKMRPHDHEVGWFNVVAYRHGIASQERIQAKAIMDADGQLYWPALDTENAAESKRFAQLEVVKS